MRFPVALLCSVVLAGVATRSAWAQKMAVPPNPPPTAAPSPSPASPAEPEAQAEVADGEQAPVEVAPRRVQACVTAEAPVNAVRQPHHWDPRSGYGVCSEICGQDEACVDGRCVVRCVPSCREGAYCTAEQECLPMPRVGAQQPTEAELQRRLGAKSATATHAALVDLGGVFFMGIRPTFEWGNRHSFHVRAVLLNTGMMPYFLEPRTAVERFEWGFGASVGYRHYEAAWGTLRGIYWGAGLDYAATEVRDPFENLVATVTHYAAGYGEFGYRWVFGDFLFGFGPALAVKVPVWVDRRPLPGGGACLGAGSCPRDATARFEGTMVMEVGWLE
jgi:hypothetical protein